MVYSNAYAVTIDGEARRAVRMAQFAATQAAQAKALTDQLNAAIANAETQHAAIYSAIAAVQTKPGPAGADGLPGKDSTVPGPRGADGLAGAASTVPGPRGTDGLPGKDSTVAGPRGLPGADGAASTVPGPAGKDGLNGTNGKDSTVAGPAGKDGINGTNGKDSVVPGPTGPSGLSAVGLSNFTTAAVLLGASADLTVTLSRAMPSTAYNVELPNINGAAVSVKLKTTTTVVLTIKSNTAAVTAGLGLFVIAWM